MATNKVFFIINKFSGTGYQNKIEGLIIDTCARLKLEAVIEHTQHPGHATELARQAVSEKIRYVFAMGGDGTLNETAQGLIGSSAALGILPKGSGNGLARHLKIPLRIQGCLKLLENYSVIDMDVLRVNGKFSINVSGAGFDAHVAGKFGKHGKKRGLVGYSKLVLKEFNSYKEFEMKATLDGQPVSGSYFVIAFANASQFGNNARVAPMASINDGKMDVSFIRKAPLAQVPAFAMKMFTGAIERSAFVKNVTGSDFHAEFSRPVPFHVDGEPFPEVKSLRVQIEPAALKVIVPVQAGRRY